MLQLHAHQLYLLIKSLHSAGKLVGLEPVCGSLRDDMCNWHAITDKARLVDAKIPLAARFGVLEAEHSMSDFLIHLITYLTACCAQIVFLPEVFSISGFGSGRCYYKAYGLKSKWKEWADASETEADEAADGKLFWPPAVAGWQWSGIGSASGRFRIAARLFLNSSLEDMRCLRHFPSAISGKRGNLISLKLPPCSLLFLFW